MTILTEESGSAQVFRSMGFAPGPISWCAFRELTVARLTGAIGTEIDLIPHEDHVVPEAQIKLRLFATVYEGGDVMGAWMQPVTTEGAEQLKLSVSNILP